MDTRTLLTLLGTGLVSLVAATMSHPAVAARPSHQTTGSGACPWVTSKAPISDRVDQLLAHMTLAQKLNELHDITGHDMYAGEVAAIPSLCIPALTMLDGPAGVGDGLMDVTQLPAPVALAATWDRHLASKYGSVVGAEDWGKGVEVDLGPTVNIARDPRWGRNFESYSEDPYLNGQMGAGYIRGLQDEGVMAEIKHWAVYNKETNRNTPLDNAIVSRRAMQEIYLPQFGMAIKEAKPASIMCSYARINGVDACDNSYLLTDVLRNQFHYKGFVVSDWGGTHSTIRSAKAGLNIEMPGDAYYGPALEHAVASGTVSVSTINHLVRPILAKMFRFHLFVRHPAGTPYSKVATPAHAGVAQKVAEAGAVLLKNDRHVLPLSASNVHSIAVIGADAGANAMTAGGGSAQVNANSIVTPYQGIARRAGHRIAVKYAQGNVPFRGPPLVPAMYLTPDAGHGHGLTEKLYANRSLSGRPVLSRTASRLIFRFGSWGRSPAAGLKTGHWSAKFTGTLDPPVTGRYTFSLTGGGVARLVIGGNKVIVRQPLSAYAETGSVELTAGHPVGVELDYYASAARSRAPLRLGWQVPVPDAHGVSRKKALLAQAVKLAKSSNVAIVFASKFESEGRDLRNIDLPGDQNQLIAAVAAANPNTIVVLNSGSAVTMPWLGKVRGVIEAWYPGQEDGDAIAALLFGDANPSGKLPVTFPKSLKDVPAHTPARWPGVNGTVAYSEGLDVGYRWYQAKHIKPLFPFGFGLSYTRFAFGDLEVTSSAASGGVIRATVRVTNTGHRRGADVVQWYVSHPAAANEPPKELLGFKKVDLKPGQAQQVTLSIPVKRLRVWNEQKDGWEIVGGRYRVWVGDSSVNLPESGTVDVQGSGSR